MTERDYRQEMDRVAMSPERQAELARAMAAEPAPARRRGRFWRGVLAAAAACVVLTASALALSPTLREALSALLGGFEPYAQAVEGVSATDQGIRISVVKAVADEFTGRAYLEITDLTGDRLEAGMTLSYNVECQSYDPETRTALVEVPLYRQMSMNAQTGAISYEPFSPHTLRYKTIYPTEKQWFEDVSIPWEQCADKVLDSYTASVEESVSTVEDRTVLIPNQTPMVLENTDLFTISSMGWDDKGSFHIQLALADGLWNTSSSITWKFDAGMVDSGYYQWGNGEWCDFNLEGGKYIDMAFHYADQFALEDFLPKTLSGFVRAGAPIKGEWELTFDLEPLPERTVTMQENMGLEHMTIEEITFSALGFRLEGSTAPGKSGGLSRFPVTIFMADGSTYSAAEGGSGWGGSGSADKGDRGGFGNSWTYDTPLEPEDIVGISFGYWYIPISGETGGPGCWLETLPE